MDTTEMKLRAGDWVEVKSPQEIAQTLDGEGTLDGLPFMPEMLEFCGQRLRVTRLAEKTCVEYPGGSAEYKIREFRRNDVVILDVSRCSGANHDGCRRACTLFWKKAWLRKVKAAQALAALDPSAQESLRPALKTISSAGRYLCQSTQLDRATQPLSRYRVILKCFRDLRTGSRGIFEMVRYVLEPIWRYVTPSFAARRVKVGNLKRTPVGNLNLRPGEWVKIKPESEIIQTLDRRAQNRGLSCDAGMRQFCGGKYKVKQRLDRMISESTGEMRQVESTVILEGLHCLCWWNHVGGCPREDYMYWREVWLERAEHLGDSSDIVNRHEPKKVESQ